MSMVKHNSKKMMSDNDNSKDNSKKMKSDNEISKVRETRKNKPKTVKVVSFNQYPYTKCLNVSNVWNLQCTFIYRNIILINI